MLCRIWHEYFTYYDEISINLSINLSVSKAETCYRSAYIAQRPQGIAKDNNIIEKL